jgi:hypothetical protein
VEEGREPDPSDAGCSNQQSHRLQRDGTTHVRFDPCDFLGRLAVLVPRPRVNLLFYHGVRGARSPWRRWIVPDQTADAQATAASSPRRHLWADLTRRSFPPPPRLRWTLSVTRRVDFSRGGRPANPHRVSDPGRGPCQGPITRDSVEPELTGANRS